MNKIPIPLNIPKNKKIQFNEVSFVEEMSEYQLKVFIKRLWQLLSTMANIFEGRRRDVTEIIDKIRSGIHWTEKEVQNRYQYGFTDNFIIQFDTLETKFILFNRLTHEQISEPINAISLNMANAYKANASK